MCEQCVEATFNGLFSMVMLWYIVLTLCHVERLYQMQHPKDVAKFDEVDYVESEGRGYWVSKAWLKGKGVVILFFAILTIFYI